MSFPSRPASRRAAGARDDNSVIPSEAEESPVWIVNREISQLRYASFEMTCNANDRQSTMDEAEVLTETYFSIWPYMIYGVILLFGFIVLILFILWLRRRITRPELAGLTRQQIAARWVEIRKASQQGLMGAKLAIMEADTLLDSGLKSMMIPGETLGERLKVAGYKYPQLQKVWWAHKLRNQLVHEATFQISPRQAHQALDEFEKALKTLNVL